VAGLAIVNGGGRALALERPETTADMLIAFLRDTRNDLIGPQRGATRVASAGVATARER